MHKSTLNARTQDVLVVLLCWIVSKSLHRTFSPSLLQAKPIAIAILFNSILLVLNPHYAFFSSHQCMNFPDLEDSIGRRERQGGAALAWTTDGIMELVTVIKKNPKTSVFGLYPKNPQPPSPQQHLLPYPDLQPHHARTLSLTPLPEAEFHLAIEPFSHCSLLTLLIRKL